MAKFTINVNGIPRTLQADPDMPLLWALRDRLALMGTKFGCGIGQCGACTVHIDDVATRSCSLRIADVGDKAVVTIEGLAEGDELHPLQRAWIEEDVSQCGYCQAGQIMSAAALLKRNPNPSDQDIDQALAGNYCRCGTYIRIRAAIHKGAQYYSAAAPATGDAEIADNKSSAKRAGSLV
jgi:aerobic-type carbon monoxide dehydrogenase small subunit (CoxS/CutS family)|tara:strand:+ start:2251 stop:2790 length:540 start_codon:yes stop_codon:yes gene_type:complete